MEEQAMKLLFLTHHWTNNSHHSAHSGFQRLVQFAAETNEVTVVTWAPQPGEYSEGPIRVITVKGGRRDFLFSKRIAISRMGAALASRYDAVHALYEDCSFSLRPNGYIVTFHVLPGVVRYHQLKQRVFIFLKYNILQRRALRNAASIACVSTNLLAAIPKRYRGKACFIPHGVDTAFWDPHASAPEALAKAARSPEALAKAARPPEALANEAYILCVGAHGLDRALLTEFIRANPTRTFVIVGLRDRLDSAPNTRYLYNVPDGELRNLYAGATLMIRPLQFATANNSVLEALSMGKTILASRIPGLTDYLTDKSAIFIDTLPDRSLDGIEARCPDPSFIRQIAVETFSWQKILADYTILYHKSQTNG
jgi:glycosyltransferase involved in cell wall biosynthesis